MDGTLSDTDPVHRGAMTDTLAAQGVALDDELFHRHVSGQSNEAIFGHFFPTLSEEARRRLADEKEALYRRLTPRMTPMPGLSRLIGWAKARGLALALVTNGPRRNVEHTLEVLGLTGGSIAWCWPRTCRAPSPTRCPIWKPCAGSA